MPSKRRSSSLVLFSSDDPQPLVEWLCDTYGLQAVLQSVAQYQLNAVAQIPTKRAYKKGGAKKGGSKKGAKKAAKKGTGKKGASKKSKSTSTLNSGHEVGNG